MKRYFIAGLLIFVATLSFISYYYLQDHLYDFDGEVTEDSTTPSTPMEQFEGKYGEVILADSFFSENVRPIIRVGSYSVTIEIFDGVVNEKELRESFLNVVDKLYLLNSCDSDNDVVIDDPTELQRQYDLCYGNLEKFSKRWIKGELITIWFDNVRDPEVSLEEAQSYAKNLMEEVHDRIVTNYLPFEDAARMITEDSFMPKVDVSYLGNAYIPFTKYDGEDVVLVEPELSEEIWNADVGHVSEIKELEPYYLIYIVNKKSEGTAVERVLDESRLKYEVEIL